MRRERRFAGEAGLRVWAIDVFLLEATIVRRSGMPIQCRIGRPVIPLRYGSTRIMAVEVFQRGRRTAALRSGGASPAHLAATALPRDTGPGTKAWRGAFRP